MNAICRSSDSESTAFAPPVNPLYSKIIPGPQTNFAPVQLLTPKMRPQTYDMLLWTMGARNWHWLALFGCTGPFKIGTTFGRYAFQAPASKRLTTASKEVLKLCR